MSTPVPDQTRRLTRASRGRLVAGVAAGLAEHLGLPTWLVRVAFVLTAGITGLGVVLYAAYWAVVPLTGAERDRASRRRPFEFGQLAAFVVVGVAMLIALNRLGLGGNAALVVPALVVAIGVALVWRQADEGRGDARRGALPPGGWAQAIAGRGWVGVARVVAGVGFVGVGVIGFLALSGAPLNRNGLVAVGAVVVGLALVSGPWWWRVYSDLSEERRARIRSEERAEIAAHVHDSVLHTLALIQRHSESPREVARLARGQERELRRWLYQSSSDPQTTFAAALRAVAAEIEDTYAIGVEVVVVGDATLDDALRAVVQAAREALVNAGRHSGVEQVSLYAEVEGAQVSVFVRDRGRGFDPAAVGRDRHGIAGSICDRMERNGGRAHVISAPREGTEIRLTTTVRESTSDSRGQTERSAT